MSADLLTSKEAAVYLSVSERWIKRAIAERTLPFVKIGHFVRFEKHELDTYIRKSRVPAVER